MKSLQLLKSGLGALSLFLAVATTSHANSSYFTYSLDTTAYAGTSGFLAFDLINGDNVANNSVIVSNLATNGVLADASDFSLGDTAFFNEVLRSITLGTTLSFNFALTENFAGGTPDSFALYLLDNTGFFSVFATLDPLGTDALVAIDVDGSAAGNAGAYAGSLSVPDQGSTLALSGLALGLLVFARRQGLGRMAA